MNLDINVTRCPVKRHCASDGASGRVEDRHVWLGAERAATVGIDRVDGRHLVGIHDLGVAVRPALVIDMKHTSATRRQIGGCLVHWRRRGLDRHGLGLG